MKLIEHTRTAHELIIESKNAKIAFMPDLHWDNPKCKRDILKRDLDYCLENEIPVVISGDFFCLMQGRADRRSNKSDIRPEHNNAKYVDSVIETAVQWFKPYASILKLISYGNHETALIKYIETDVLQRFQTLFNYETGGDLKLGGYGGFIVVRQMFSGSSASTVIKYFHGAGGAAVVTKGAIDLTRALEKYDAEAFVMGHIHYNMARTDVREYLKSTPKTGFESAQKEVHGMVCGTYKEEYEDGHHGWHVERGAPPKVIGGRIMTIDVRRSEKDGRLTVRKIVDSHRFTNI